MKKITKQEAHAQHNALEYARAVVSALWNQQPFFIVEGYNDGLQKWLRHLEAWQDVANKDDKSSPKEEFNLEGKGK